MAELVHLRLEAALPELEEMERIGLFARNEIRQIIKKRERYEYKLRKRMKRKEDYLQYIDFEVNLLALIEKRRDRLLCDSKKKEIDYSISRRINSLFKIAISKFPEDEKLYLDQIQFCKKRKMHETISSLYTKLLRVHSQNPKLWVMAAKWEMEESHSPDNARTLLQRAVLMLPNSDLLWREYFRMELMYVGHGELIHKRREVLNVHHMKDSEENDAVLSGQVAIVVYDKAVEEIDDVDFALSFLQICFDFDFTAKHVEYILNDVQRRYPNKEETLDALAKRPLINLQEQIEKGKKEGLKKKAILQKIHDEICSKYDEAVESQPTEKMWSFYLEFLFSLVKSVKENKKRKLQDTLLSKFEEAANAGHLSLVYYSHWSDLLFERGREDDALAVSLSAARKANRVSHWVRCITLHIRGLKSSKTVYLLLMEALSTLKEKDTMPLWKLGVEWLSICDPEKLIEFFEKGIHQSKEVSLPLKEMYLEATMLRNGPEAATELYKKLKKMGPISLQLIRKIVAIEKGQLKPSLELLRKYFEDGVKEFGATHIDIWLDYMKFESEQSGCGPANQGRLFWRAMKTLKPELTKEFQERITEVSTGCPLATHWELIS
ncbi:U3 small nucleolar RNA-associated protein 6 homolog [Uloborus diversus]|uniref:U3 small nucleolar RNA-associated protein 6 homolog n=1 Tax=Uloborus diversus TaxID=327109 RepID=UPI0024097664|nr:U3 small nucleolar RNA-associated protein 6 homolog [Uloborus diversus]